MKLEVYVREAMMQHDRCKNDDNYLAVMVWHAISPGSFVKVGNGWAIATTAFLDGTLPPHSHIQRIRSYIQNDLGELLPTDQRVLEFRRSHKKDQHSYEKVMENIGGNY